MLLIFESLLVCFQELKGPFIFYKGGGGTGGIWKASYKNHVTPSAYHFFFYKSPLLPQSFFLDDLRPKKILTLSQDFYLF